MEGLGEVQFVGSSALARASGSVLICPPLLGDWFAGLKRSFILLYPHREGEQGGTEGGSN